MFRMLSLVGCNCLDLILFYGGFDLEEAVFMRGGFAALQSFFVVLPCVVSIRHRLRISNLYDKNLGVVKILAVGRLDFSHRGDHH